MRHWGGNGIYRLLTRKREFSGSPGKLLPGAQWHPFPLFFHQSVAFKIFVLFLNLECNGASFFGNLYAMTAFFPQVCYIHYLEGNVYNII